jgi:hypothetical protein
MGLFTKTPPTPPIEPINVQELVNRFGDTIEVLSNAIVVAERPGMQLATTANNITNLDTRELGTTGRTNYGSIFKEDYNVELRGVLGLQVYDRMRKSDGQQRGTLRLLKTPILGARWYMEPASPDEQDIKIAKFVWDNFTKWMSVSWPQLLQECLLHLEFGWYAFEKVWDLKMVEGEQRAYLRKLAVRHPLDYDHWEYDRHGGPKGCSFYGDDARSKFIPMRKLICFTNEKEAGNMEGFSILRSAYKHWYYKENLYKIDAIQKERHGIGVPVIKLPPGFSAEDKRLADEMGRNLRTNEKAHVVLPPNWDILMLKMEGNPVDALESADHHDLMVARNILAQFLNQERNDGSAIKEAGELFTKSTKFIADQVRDVFNKWVIPELVDYNWDVEEYPELRVRRIGETVDWRTISFALRNFIGAGVVVPDEKLEMWVRDEMDLPMADPATKRDLFTPQAPGANQGGVDVRPGPGGAVSDAAHQNQGVGAKPAPPRVGMPRQSQARNMKTNAGSSNIGRDGKRQ